MKEVKPDLCPRKHSGKWRLFWQSLIRDSCWREKEKLFSRKLSKNILEEILGTDERFPKISEKDFRGGRTVPKISWKGFEGRTVARLIGISKSKGWREEREAHRGERQFSSIPWIPNLRSSESQLSKWCWTSWNAPPWQITRKLHHQLGLRVKGNLLRSYNNNNNNSLPFYKGHL